MEFLKHYFKEKTYFLLPQAVKDSYLRQAVLRSDDNEVELLLKNKANPFAPNNNGISALMLAAKGANRKTFATLFESDTRTAVDLIKRDKYGVNLLMYAAKGGNIKIIEKCLKKGFSIEDVNVMNRKPLWFSVYNGHFHATCLFLEKGNFKDLEVPTLITDKFSLVTGALKSGNESLITMFVDLYNKVPCSEKKFFILFQGALENNIKAIRILLKNGHDLYQEDREEGQTLLNWCAWYNWVEPLGLLFLYAPKQHLCNKKNKSGHSAVRTAIIAGNYDVSQILLDESKIEKVVEEEARFLVKELVETQPSLLSKSHIKQLPPLKRKGNISTLLRNREIGC